MPQPTLKPSEPKTQDPKRFAAFIGLDWADQKHDLCLSTAGSEEVEYSVLEQSPEAIDQWVGQLRQRFGGKPVAICVEQSRGAVVHALMKYEFLVLFPLAPARLANYRQAVTSSGAKDDPTDANWLWDYLVRHRDRLVAWKPDEPLTRQIALLAETRRDAVNLRTSFGNQLKAVLKGYFPQALTMVGETVHSQQLHRAQPQMVRKFYYSQNCRSESRIKERLEIVKNLVWLTTDSAIINSSLAKVRLLAAFGDDRDRMDSPASMQCLSGIAPVTRRSGKRCSVQRRCACSKFLRQTFHEFAGHSRLHCAWAGAFYESQRVAGKGHHTAVRALAFKWIRILFRCWKTRTPYDEATYIGVLERRNAPLLKYLKQPATACA